MKRELGSNPAEKSSLNRHKSSLKERAAHQLREFLVMFIYLWTLFTLFIMGFHILERVIVGVWSGRTIAQSFPTIGGGSVDGILSLGANLFVALVPFFVFREISRVIGRGELWSLLLSPGARVYTLQSRLQRW